MQVALDRHVLIDVLADLLQVVFRDILDADVGVDAGSCDDFLGRGVTDAVDVGQAGLDTLFAR